MPTYARRGGGRSDYRTSIGGRLVVPRVTRPRGREIDGPVLEPRDVEVGPIEQGHQIFLTGLPEDHPVGGELTLQALERLDLGRVRQLGNVALHPMLAGRDPVRHQVVGISGARSLFRQVEDQTPEILAGAP